MDKIRISISNSGTFVTVIIDDVFSNDLYALKKASKELQKEIIFRESHTS